MKYQKSWDNEWKRKIAELAERKKYIRIGDFNRIYHNEVVKLQSTQLQIDHYYEPKEESDRRRIHKIVGELRPEKKDFVLDLGCGVGTFAFHCAKKGAHSVGVDYSLESIKVARKLVSMYDVPGKVEFLVADVTKMPFQDCLFDKIVCADLIEHLTPNQKEKAVKEMYRVLTAGGIVVLHTPNRLRGAIRVFLLKFGGQKQSPHSLPQVPMTLSHIGETSTFELKHIFIRNNFKIKYFYEINNVSIISKVLERLSLSDHTLKAIISSTRVLRDFLTESILMIAFKNKQGRTN